MPHNNAPPNVKMTASLLEAEAGKGVQIKAQKQVDSFASVAPSWQLRTPMNSPVSVQAVQESANGLNVGGGKMESLTGVGAEEEKVEERYVV